MENICKYKALYFDLNSGFFLQKMNLLDFETKRNLNLQIFQKKKKLIKNSKNKLELNFNISQLTTEYHMYEYLLDYFLQELYINGC